ncbi:gastrula zinc finger protein XlCGF57.1-like [Melanotaenia boesemani]|uniref:gastrula zinc finger protein XlCGF57.1-like n=1 Tax=Melanotaenia boesemani TaxID=1250792 RepID=UPI001C054D79|nr:gastrula zinc finger protein XlCGF57.1-like [Melanotaenia boesemani]XP_041829670.1 gastrula zinc finger protein XlCGF57.1-like [Melanotaenia boesemani]
MPRRRKLQPDDPRGLDLVPSIPAESTSELEQTQNSKDTMLPADVQPLLVIKEEVPWSSLDQQDPEPLHIKEEEEELWTSQVGEKLDGKETDISRFSFTAVTVKSEDDEEKPQSSQLHQIKTEDSRDTKPPTSSSDTQMKTEADGEVCGGPEPTMNLAPNNYLQQNTDENEFFEAEVSIDDDEDYWQDPLSDSESETEDGDRDWRETGEPNSGVNKDLGCSASKKSVTYSTSGKDCESSLKSNKTVHAGRQTFVCSYCGKKIIYESDFKKHLRVHTGEKPYHCDICGKSFSQRGTLSNHMKIHTGEKPFTCNDCGKRFNKRAHLEMHMRIHTGEKPFSCNICGRRFHRNEHLKTHVGVHTGEKPFSCLICAKRFTRNTLLKTHMRVHTGEKPFACSDCGKRFNQRANLKTHMRVHTGEKPFSCVVCGKRFNQISNLKTHVRVHARKKPYPCDECGKKFNTETHLKTHMRVHKEKNRLAVMIVKDYFAKNTAI